ncbi:MAG: superinfection immunity protein [Fluviibacter sp.]
MEPLIFGIFLVVVYFLPAASAYSRKHKSRSAILLVNLIFGWTLVGWLWAAIWCSTGNIEEPGPDARTHVKCPDCRELVLRDARKCKHCGAALIPQ